jgi:microcystin-dependent protein
MAFTTNAWTNAGINLLTSIVAGSGEFVITKVEAGNGYPAGADNPASFAGLKSYIMDGQITSINVETPSQVTVRIRVQSQYAPVEFRWNEFGIYASDGVSTPVMAVYGTTGADIGDTITPSSSSANINRDCAVLLPFSTAVTVTTTATLNPAPELHAATHRSDGADPLALAQSTTSGVAPPAPNNASQVLLGSSPVRWGAVPLHAPTHIDSGSDPVPVTTVAHDGLCPKLSGDNETVLRGDGTWGIGVAPGIVLDFAGATPPTGWLMCDGQLYSTTTYSLLFSVIGYTYGGSGGVFAVPDARGRTTIGAGQGSGLTNRGLAGIGGEETHVLSTSELAQHNHGVNDAGHSHSIYDPTHVHGVSQSPHSHGIYDPTHAHSVADPGHAHGVSDPGHGHTYESPINYQQLGGWASTTPGWGSQQYWTSSNATGIGIYGSGTGVGIYKSGTGVSVYGANANISINGAATGIATYASATGITTQSAGANGGHNNMQPYLALNKIIKF